MNISTNLIFDPKVESKDICNQIISEGTRILKQSRKIDKFEISLREVFGLCLLATYRDFLEPDKKWAFTTEPKISDDGAVVHLEDKKIQYCELVEQVYLPGPYLKRKGDHSMNDHILDQVLSKKNKGAEYLKDTSLFILNDIQSENNQDYFEWQDFAKCFFERLPFLHLYFVGLTDHKQDHNSYYLFSFTNQVHRQHLNGEFAFQINSHGINDFKCTQLINLLDPKSGNSS